MSKARAYRIWSGMVQRCTNPNVERFSEYGGRGISVCNRWLRFEGFIADMGEPPDDYSIERKNNNGNYEPENCHWIPLEQQSQNRRGNRYVEIDGKTVCASEAARHLGIKASTIRYRLKHAKNKKDIAAPVGKDVFLTLNGETLNLTQWSDRLGLKKTTITMRRKKGWPVERILEAVR